MWSEKENLIFTTYILVGGNVKKVMFVIMVLTVIVTVGCTSQAEKEAMIFHETAISLMKDYSQAE